MNISEFTKRNEKIIKRMGKDNEFEKISQQWFLHSLKHEYSYHFEWLGLPIIQYPQDIIAYQEIIWNVKPDLIIETGIARGGSLVLSASILQLIGKGQVLGIDIDIKKENLKKIETHVLKKRIKMIQGSSTDKNIIKQIKKIAKNKKKIMVVLDSNHTHEHVLKELESYSQFVKKGCYIIVFDTIIEDIPQRIAKKSKRLWGKGNSPKSAVKEFLKKNSRFIIDTRISDKLQISVAPSGYLKCIK
jgi:cephalosporin hydroxylase